jgi:hypothetical protein
MATMKITGTLPRGFAAFTGLFRDGDSRTRPRSTRDNASAVIKRTALEITKGSRGS